MVIDIMEFKIWFNSKYGDESAWIRNSTPESIQDYLMERGYSLDDEMEEKLIGKIQSEIGDYWQKQRKLED